RRHCNYGPINPIDAHKLFLRHALVEGELFTNAKFFVHNQALIQKVEKLEHKLRRPDFLVDEEVLYQFYDERIPKHIYSKPAFEKWVKKTEKESPKKLEALFLTEQDLMKQSASDSLLLDFPDQVHLSNQMSLEVDYHFEPGKKRDGLIYHLPLSGLNSVQSEDFEWLTPGLLKEKTAFYIKSLPKSLRKQFIPAPQYADLVLTEMSPDKILSGSKKEPYLNQLVWALNRRANVKVSLNDLSDVVLPEHLKPYFVLEDDKGRKLAENSRLLALKEEYQHLVDAKIQKHQAQKQAEDIVITEWVFGDLADSQTIKSQGKEMLAYPALQLQNSQIVLGLMGEQQAAMEQHGQAVIVLIERLLSDKSKYLQKKLPMQKACLCYAPYGTCQDLTQQVIDRALHELVPYPEKLRTQNEFEKVLNKVQSNWIDVAQRIAKQVNTIFTLHQQVAKQVRGRVNPRWLASVSDIQHQLDELISKDFVRNTPDFWFKQIERYLKALQMRLEKLDLDPNKDQKSIREIQPLLKKYQEIAQEPAYQNLPGLVDIRWMLEELRISLFSQPMKTIKPVSIQRIEKQIKAL
ncbi:DUF3418 domain-containing protein, partial [Thiomicrorhabdus sp. Kp2]|uniref:DUF3418 domain-containing protein n=1 Tax=Thiomicrorhabdus sp. Kp2 TaxID=1123518 RepID=UPI0005945E9A